MAPHRLPKEKKLLAAEIVQRLYFDPDMPTQSKLADEFQIEKSTVSRLLSYAREEGIFSIQLNLPRHEALELELERAFGITAIVFPINPPRSEAGPLVFTQLLAQSAASYLEGPSSPIRTDAPSQRIGISCGATIRDLIASLSSGRFHNLVFSQLTVETETSGNIDQSPFTLVASLYGKWRKGSTVFAVQPMPGSLNDGEGKQTTLYAPHFHRIRESARNLDLAILGVGDFNPEGDGSFPEILHKPDIDLKALNKLRPIGEIVNRPFNQDGEDLFHLVNNLAKYVHGIELEDLRGLVKQGKHVIAIAGGPKKVDAIRVALRTKLVNHLITDSATAEGICASKFA